MEVTNEDTAFFSVDEYEALAIPGGFEEFGFYEEAYDERFLNLIREFDSKGNIITSHCPETASSVAFKLLEMLTSKEKMEIVKKAMGF